MPWLIAPHELTPDQLRAVELPVKENRLIVGLPGSGKTQVLLHRAAELKRTLGGTADTYRIFLFTNVLRDYVKSGLSYLDLDESSVSTFDHWCRVFYEHHVDRRLPYLGGQPDFGKIREGVLRILKANPDLRHSLDFVLVDEGQDLSKESYQILTLSAKHVTVFADFLQSMFSEGAGEDALRSELGIRQRNVTLLGAYRNSSDVAKVAGLFIDDEERRAQYLYSAKPNASERERPVLVRASSFDSEVDALAEEIRKRMILNQTVGILVAQNRILFGLAKGLQQRGMPVELAVPPRRGQSAPDYDGVAPKIATYHSAKGLTFDVVLMPRLLVNAFGAFSPAERQKMLFVGAARARQWVYFSTYGTNALPELERLDRAGKEGALVIRTDSAPVSDVAAPEDEDEDIDLL